MLHILFFIIAFISMMILLHFDVSIISSFLITFVILIICNYTIGYIIFKLQGKVLDSDCDPEHYLKMIDNQEKRFRKKQRVVNYLDINRAAGHILLGDFKTAKEYLEEIDTSYLLKNNMPYLVYTINLILCYYELGEIEKAEILYETNLVQLCPLGKRLQKSVDILIGERYFYLKKYDLSYEYLKKLLHYDLNKRQYLGILYRLAQMDVINGATEQAAVKFKKIAKLGNKLWIAKSSQEILENMKIV